MTIRPFERLGRKVLFGSGSLAGLLLGWSGAGALSAQTLLPTGVVEKTVPIQESAPRNYFNKSAILLPIQIEEPARALIQEIHLYVKESAAAPWTLRSKAGPGQKDFTFQVPQDGEYRFTMVTIDKQGRSFPSDLRNEPAALIVVIDTQRPEVELTNLGQAPEGQLVQCDVRDANLDLAKTQFSFQGGDKMFRPLEPVAGRGNVFCIPVQAVSTGVIRVRAVDLAGNETVCEEQISKLKAPAGAATDIKANEVQPMQKAAPIEGPKQVGYRPDGTDGPRIPIDDPISNPTPTPVQELPKRQFVNSTKIFLDYQIENGAQGGARVEVWLTRDQGKSWQKACEDTQRKSPLEVQLPGDGLFGLMLVATNGRSAAVPPAAGQTPESWIEVDTTNPSAQITKVETVIEAGQPIVRIQWSAQDKNLADAPVDLLYAATPQGPWLPIAKGLKAQGQHRWAVPKEVGVQVHLRMIARDVAGNTGVCNISEPVQLAEPVPPRAVIRTISTSVPSPLPLPMPPRN